MVDALWLLLQGCGVGVTPKSGGISGFTQPILDIQLVRSTRTAKGGRDHWPRVSCAMLAGGNMRHGQVIGSTDKIGAEPADRPVAFGEVFATLYHHLGIDVNKVTLPDHSGRPQYLIDGGWQPMAELV